jgi:hypothetical protein
LYNIRSFYVERDDLEETINLASLGINIDVEVAGGSGETRDGLNIGSKCVPGKRLAIELRM